MDIKSRISLLRKKRERISLTATVIIWSIVFLAWIFIPAAPPEKQYKTVQIQLVDELPVKEPIPVQKPEPVVRPEEKVPEKTVEKPKNVVDKTVSSKKQSVKQSVPSKETTEKKVPVPGTTAPETAVSNATKKTNAVSAPVKPKLVKSVDELMSEQASESSSSAAWDESVFNDSQETTTEPDAAMQKITAPATIGHALEGSAASASEISSASVSSESGKKSSVSAKTSAATTSALGKIKSTSYIQHSAGITSTSAINSAETESGATLIQLVDGSERMLLDPKKPDITISEKNASLIDSSRTITIYFTVLAEGNVPLSKIEIKPASSLPVVIQAEIKAQISEWRFATDTADGLVKFSLTIKKE